MCYYNRPNLVKHALYSLKSQTYKNWVAIFVDDGSEARAEESIRGLLGEESKKINYINTLMSLDDKNSFGGSIFGLYWTHACIAYQADIAVMLCDDDALLPDYLENLNKWFSNNPQKNWCYSHYLSYDPYSQNNFHQIKTFGTSPNYIHDINPDSLLDASQVAFKIWPFKQLNVEFAFPLTANLDSDIYRKLYPLYGKCTFTGFFSQYKGQQNNRLEIRQNQENIYSNSIDIDWSPF